jgi:hypothetical protein
MSTVKFLRIALLRVALGAVVGALGAFSSIVIASVILLSISPLDAMFAAFVVGYPLVVIGGIIGTFIGLAMADRIVARLKQKR